MLAQQVIAKKRDGKQLTEQEITFMVAGMSNHQLSDAQLGAFAMAVFCQGMTMDERINLTNAMMHSGRVLDWQGMDIGPIVDKHSTGGVGDKVSLILAPLIAACGGFVPMISGRGLGHTGGTLDKLESLAGYNAYPTEHKFKQVVKQAGCAIIGQTDDLAPADRRFYATRDVTATVESIDLITASILSKKLAANLDALVMDVKTGNGAFAASFSMANELAQSIVAVAKGSGVACRCLITDMNQVLGHSVGNAVEVQEAVNVLMDPRQSDPRLLAITLELAAHILDLAGLASDKTHALQLGRTALTSGAAAEVFAQMCSLMGVRSKPLSDNLFAEMPIVKPLVAQKTGYITHIDTQAIGMAMVEIGAGRHVATSSIDHGLGLTHVLSLGQQVSAGDPLAIAHVRNQTQFDILEDVFTKGVAIEAQQGQEHALIVACL